MLVIKRRSLCTAATAFALLTVVAACTTLPAAGPQSRDVNAAASAKVASPQGSVAYNYAMVDLNERILSEIHDPRHGSLLASFGGGRGPAPEILVGVGDVVQVSIFESSDGGLFIPKDAGARPGNYVTLPSQTVDRRGTITVPYAGLVPAVGRSLPQIGKDIETRLSNRAIEPQAVVALLNQKASEVAIVGEVNAPNKLPINPAGDKVADIVSRASGLKFPDYESFVTLQRRGRTASVYFKTLIENPKENIYVAPGDLINVYRLQRTFVAYGASGLNGQFDFQTDNVTLAEGVARAGGLIDQRADPSQVYVYRVESREALQRMGVDLSRFPPEKQLIPTVFRGNFRDPSSLFVAQRFHLRDKDAIYVSNAEAVELYKFLGLIDAVSGTVGGVASDSLTIRRAIR